MKRAHNVTLTVFVKDGEDEASLKEGLLSLLPFSAEEEKIAIERSVSTGLSGNRIVILSLRLEKERHTSAFLDSLRERLSGAQREQLLEQRNRLDDRCDYFLRFEKGSLPGLVLTDGGECVHVRIGVAAFPKRPEVAWGVVKEMFI